MVITQQRSTALTPSNPSSNPLDFYGSASAKTLAPAPNLCVPRPTAAAATMKSAPLVEQFLLRPDDYIGSVEKHTQTTWVFESFHMMQRTVTYVPGLHRIFDEIIVKQRDPSMDALHVEIDVSECRISVYNNAERVPVEVHQEKVVYVLEMIFGHFSSTNYEGDKNLKETIGWRDGNGVKLANVFSTEFIIETADGRRLKKYKQVFSENMGKKSEPQITDCKKGENWTRITFKPDLAKFNLTHLEEDVVSLMRKRVFDIAATLGETVNVVLDGRRLRVKNFSNYVDLHIISASKKRLVELPRICEKVNDQWEVCESLSEGQFEQVSFVNGIATIRGGSHVDYMANKIAHHVMNVVNDKKSKNFSVEVHDVKRHLWIFVNARIENPSFDSLTKFLTTPQESFGLNCAFSDVFLNKVVNCGVVRNMLLSPGFKSSKGGSKSSEGGGGNDCTTA